MGVLETGFPQSEQVEGMNCHRTVQNLGQGVARQPLLDENEELQNIKMMGVSENGVPQTDQDKEMNRIRSINNLGQVAAQPNLVGPRTYGDSEHQNLKTMGVSENGNPQKFQQNDVNRGRMINPSGQGVARQLFQDDIAELQNMKSMGVSETRIPQADQENEMNRRRTIKNLGQVAAQPLLGDPGAFGASPNLQDSSASWRVPPHDSNEEEKKQYGAFQDRVDITASSPKLDQSTISWNLPPGEGKQRTPNRKDRTPKDQNGKRSVSFQVGKSPSGKSKYVPSNPTDLGIANARGGQLRDEGQKYVPSDPSALGVSPARGGQPGQARSKPSLLKSKTHKARSQMHRAQSAQDAALAAANLVKSRKTKNKDDVVKRLVPKREGEQPARKKSSVLRGLLQQQGDSKPKPKPAVVSHNAYKKCLETTKDSNSSSKYKGIYFMELMKWQGMLDEPIQAYKKDKKRHTTKTLPSMLQLEELRNSKFSP